jgi:hypothetical protein
VLGDNQGQFDIEEWAAIEADDRLHIFISIWSVEHPNLEVSQDIVVTKDGKLL